MSNKYQIFGADLTQLDAFDLPLKADMVSVNVYAFRRAEY